MPGFENFPATLQPAFQQNMLDREFQEQLDNLLAIRRSAYRKEQPIRSGEVTIYSRAGRLVPVVDDADPTANLGLDNGLTNIGGVGAAANTYPLEQYRLRIGMVPYALDLNLYQEQETMASTFRQNVENLGEQAATSLDLKAIVAGFSAYEGGATYVKDPAAGTAAGAALVNANAPIPVDNVLGLDTAFAQVQINGVYFSQGEPQAVSVQFPLKAVKVDYATGVGTPITITGVAYDNPNTSDAQTPTLKLGKSGALTVLENNITCKQGDIIKAFDAPVYKRPGLARSRYELTKASTATIQMVLNAVSDLRANRIKPPLADNTYPCYIDPILDAQFFQDPAFQIMTQGQENSETFKDGRLHRNLKVTFVPVSTLPAYNFTSKDGTPLIARRMIIVGERWLQEGPFAGQAIVAKEVAGASTAHDIRIIDDIVMVHRMPLDRFGQTMSQGWFYIGGFCVPTDATITRAVLPSATPARYKRAVICECAATE